LANALASLGVSTGDRIATLAWNTHRHLELYFAVSGSGAVLHTVNPRLFEEQILYIVNHGEAHVLFFDVTFAEVVARLAPSLPAVKTYVAMTDRAHMPDVDLPDLRCYEELIASNDDRYEWPQFDERTASTLCYTSGTTGHPKGVLYSHRATLLHTLKEIGGDSYGITAASCVLLAVPMFHANAWGLPYASAMTGAKVVMPGRHLDGKSVFELIRDEAVTFSVGVPTIWLGLFQHIDATPDCDLSGLKLQKLGVGGATVPLGLILRIERELGATVVQGWGMTEIFTIGALNTPTVRTSKLPAAEYDQLKTKAGRALWGVELKITDEQGLALPHDGVAFGNLKARGPWTVARYFRADESALDADGWFDTGDVATIDPDGYIQMVDRSKDLVKSGGEWISSIQVESVALTHPAVAQAAVIGLPHPRWSERPILLVVKKEGAEVTREAMIAFLRERMATWWVPDDVVFLADLPLTATGKISKRTLRERLRDHRLPSGGGAAS
jgi:fatty-acyl-CoA synthase